MWEKFVEPDFEMPNVVVNRLIDGFEAATTGLASLKVIELTGYTRNNDLDQGFQYAVILTSKFTGNYNFEIFRFGFDVDGYPVAVIIDEGIAFELSETSRERLRLAYTPQNQSDFEESIQFIFSTRKFKNTVGGLMKIARSQLHNADDIPF